MIRSVVQSQGDRLGALNGETGSAVANSSFWTDTFKLEGLGQ